MVRGAKDGCLEFDAMAFAREAERIAEGGHFLPNEVGYSCNLFVRQFVPTDYD